MTIQSDYKERFNQYCADVMQYKDSDLNLLYDREYNPYDDLNLLSEVVETLMRGSTIHLNNFHRYFAHSGVMAVGMTQAFRDFVESTR